MIKYKIIESTIPYLKNIEIEHDFSEVSTGDELSILGHNLTVTQKGEVIIGAANSDTIFIFQKLDVS